VPTSNAAPTRLLRPTASATWTPDVQASATAYEATATAYADYLAAVAQAVMTAAPARVVTADTSPDGRWQVDFIAYDCVEVTPGSEWFSNAYEQLLLTNLSSGAETLVADQVQSCGGLGAYGLGGYTWSPNSRYYYFTGAANSVPDGLCGYWMRPVHRVEAATGQIEYVGGAHFSPDLTKLTFWQGSDVVVWTLNDGEMARFRVLIADDDPNVIAWSPDSQSLVALQNDSECFPYRQSVVTRLDLPTHQQAQVLSINDPTFTSVNWDRPNSMTLSDELGQAWRYNFVTDELRRIEE
jgi:hypothetical protein